VRASYTDRLSESGALIRDANLRVSYFAMSIDYDLSHLLPRRPLDDLRLALTSDFREQRDLFQTEDVTGVQLGLSWRLRWGLSRIVFRYEDLHFATPRSKPKERT